MENNPRRRPAPSVLRPRMGGSRARLYALEGASEGEADAGLKHYRLEIINQIGYIVSTVTACAGLLNYEAFLHFAQIHQASIPLVIAAASIMVAYLISRTYKMLHHIASLRPRYSEKLFSRANPLSGRRSA